jgi:hypothetical protein
MVLMVGLVIVMAPLREGAVSRFAAAVACVLENSDDHAYRLRARHELRHVRVGVCFYQRIYLTETTHQFPISLVTRL